jgi:hypothetical protein
VQFFAESEVDAGNLVDDIAQGITVLDAVGDALEHRGNNIPAVVAVGTGECAQITKQPYTAFAVPANCFVIVDEGERFVAGDAPGLGSPNTPSIVRFDSKFELRSSELGLALAIKFQIIKELQEHTQVSICLRSRSPLGPSSSDMMPRAEGLGGCGVGSKFWH